MEFLDDWRVIEGNTLTTNRVSSTLAMLPKCQEREDLFQIAQMLINEGFNPEDFWVKEYPIKGTYCIERKCDQAGVDYFMIESRDGILVPQYVTEQMINNRNLFDCETIKDSIKRMEC